MTTSIVTRHLPSFALGLLVLGLGSACGATDSAATPTDDTSTQADGGTAGSGVLPAEGGAEASAPPPQGGYVPSLGAVLDGDTLRFRARSAHATHLSVALFAKPMGEGERTLVPLTRASGTDAWEGSLTLAAAKAAGIGEVIYYGYRAWGPNWTFDPAWKPGSTLGFVSDVDADGNRMNPNKLLIDPYAREISHDPASPGHIDGSMYAVGANNRAKDSAQIAPKSIVLPAYALDTGPAPTRAWKDDIVYEVQLRGFTRRDPAAGTCAGTFAAAAKKAAYLKALGVTVVELLPVQETQNDTNDLAASTDGDNYWGYSTLAYFAPDRHFACDRTPGGPTRELAAMVRAMHDVGIKVFLDVVYNHTAEGGGSSLLSLRGMDNASYYELGSNPQTFYDNTGIGANVNVAGGIARDLATDSLVYLHRALGIDGFRFDLAAVLGNTCQRGCYNFDAKAKDNLLVRAHSLLPGVPLVAEPWGIGNGTYQLGNFPAGWSEWNGQFRDTLRAHQNQQGVAGITPGALSNAFAGSQNLYGDDGRGPLGSVNFLVSHDGFTLRDLYSCNGKNNGQAWPFGPSDGGEDNNRSWDHHGDDAEQRRAVRTGLALLMMSAGVPMIAGGDEVYRTLRCNNNSYNLDSEANWLDWSATSTEAELLTFSQRLFAFRAAHPALRPEKGWSGADSDKNGVKDVTWYRADGTEANGAYLDDAKNGYLGYRVDGAPAKDPVASIFVAYDGGTAGTHVTLPTPSAGHHWYCAGDTERATNAFAAPGAEELAATGWDLGPRAVAIFIER
jgi:glycogen operon protein